MLLYSFDFTAAAAAAIVVVLAVVTSFSLFLDFERKGQLNLLGERALFLSTIKIVCKSVDVHV